MSGERSPIDANVLVYALYADAEHHVSSRSLLDTAARGDARFCVTSQVLAEFFAIVTSPRRVSIARTPQEAVDVIESLLSLECMTVLASPESVPKLWIDLLRRRPVSAGRVFDLQLVATMEANDVRTIYTFNRRDFEVFPELDVRTPAIETPDNLRE
jgi:toxin-antitoxin system PIN domain toxin